MSIRLKITIDKDELWIRGDKAGLQYLADCCTKIIGKKDPSGHFHLMPEMNNLMAGSLKTVIEYMEDPE
jgi:hypothetical protein